MAFSFGNTGQSAFGSTAAKPTGFGTPFGAATTTTSGFSFGSSFGAPTQQQPAPAFGAATSTFGAPAQQQQPPAFGAAGSTFGSTFGAPASAAPTFGSTFGAPASTAAPSFGTGFGGAPAGGGLFGSTATSKPSLFGAPTTQSSLFSAPQQSTGTGLFGTTNTGLFGSTNTSTAAPSLFGNTATTAAPSLFGASFGNATPATTNLFGRTGTTTSSGFGLFGANNQTAAPSLFGGLGTTQPGGGFGGFGSTGGTLGAFGTSSNLFGVKAAAPAAPQNALQQQQMQNQLVVTSIYSISVFNDERDDILKKWNMLQACWGTGKGYYNANSPPIEYTPYNPYYRFKAVGYNIIPEHDNADGLVKLVFNKKYSELSGQKQVLVNGIAGILGNKPNLKVSIESVKALSEDRSEVKLLVMEKGVTGNNRKIPATDLSDFLNQPAQKQQLANVGVSSIVAYVTPSRAAIEEYLRTVPLGFDPQMWKAAVADNPDPNRYMPVPVYGFGDLKARKVKQEHETGLHRAFEEKINGELVELKKKYAASLARINEFKHKYLQLQHRTLRILVRQESIRKAGMAIQPEEEILKGKLETMYSHINVPTQFKGQLNELISTVKLMQNTKMPAQPQYKLLPEAQAELKEFLQLQQNGISKLVEIVKEDIFALNIITDGMRQILQNKNISP